MFTKGTRLRHKDKLLNDKYGVLQVLELKNDYVICLYGNPYDFNTITLHIDKVTRI